MSDGAGSPAPTASPNDGVVSPDTVLQIRKAIYGHEPLTATDMDIVMNVARHAGAAPCDEWAALFCESLTDYVVHQNDPADYIPQAKADWLIAAMTQNGGIASKAEFGMLIDVMTHALGVPASLSAFALNEIKTAIISGRRAAITGEDHAAGVVTKADVEALRAVLYAAKVGTPGHVTRDEAEVLFSIAHAVTQADAAFDDLFARAVANYLMATTLHAPEAAEALHFEKWLDEKDDFHSFWSRALHPASGESFFSLLKSPSEAVDADFARQNAADQIARDKGETITDSEAAWVIAHLSRKEDLSSAELRLLQFLNDEAASIAAPLRSLIDQTKTAALSKSA